MLHQINLDSHGGMSQFLSQFQGETWDFAFDSPARLGHIYFMSRDQMTALADERGLEMSSLVDDFPGKDSELWPVTADRDLFGFMRAAAEPAGGLAEQRRASAADRRRRDGLGSARRRHPRSGYRLASSSSARVSTGTRSSIVTDKRS